MTPRSLFIVIIKVLGILLLQSIIFAILQTVETIVAYTSNFFGDILLVFVSTLSLALFFSVSYLFIFKADYVVDKLKLARGINEPVLQINGLTSRSVLHIALIVTASVVLFIEIPTFCQKIYGILQQRKYFSYVDAKPDWSPVIFSIIKILLAFLLIGERKRILQFLERTPVVEANKEVSENETVD